MRYFYGADFHYGHFNCIRYDNRPFSSIEEMDETMIKEHNAVVTNEDTVIIAGDLSWYKEEETLKILDRLNGHKILVKGNHDRVSPKIARKFDKVVEYLELVDNGTKVVISHYPMPFWNGQFRDTVHLYGHVHNSHQHNYCLSIRKELAQLQDIPMRMYNIGVMMPYMNYRPRTLEEILEANKQQ